MVASDKMHLEIFPSITNQCSTYNFFDCQDLFQRAYRESGTPGPKTQGWVPQVGPLGKMQDQPFATVLQNRCSETFCNIHRKTAVLESLFRCVFL